MHVSYRLSNDVSKYLHMHIWVCISMYFSIYYFTGGSFGKGMQPYATIHSDINVLTALAAGSDDERHRSVTQHWVFSEGKYTQFAL